MLAPKKVLMLASVASMIDQFNMDNIKILQELGYDVDVACNFLIGNTCSHEKVLELKKTLGDLSADCYQVDFTRNVTNIKQDWVAYQQVKKIVNDNEYAFIHCHSPIGGVIGRMVGKVTRTRVIYTAHGFHFYLGAPKKNWIMYYPIEKLLSYWTDAIVTITKEDYERAKKRLSAKKVYYLPGVGINLNEFKFDVEKRRAVRGKLSLKEDDVVIFSVGELNHNKNHRAIIQILQKINNKNIHYFIAGEGCLREDLQRMIDDALLTNQIHLLGFRKDVSELLQAADVFVLPSLREGLNVSMMEAMSSSLPCICNKIRGNTDLIEHDKGGYILDISAEEEWEKRICQITSNRKLRQEMGDFNRKKMQAFSIDVVNATMKSIYQEISY